MSCFVLSGQECSDLIDTVYLIHPWHTLSHATTAFARERAAELEPFGSCIKRYRSAMRR